MNGLFQFARSIVHNSTVTNKFSILKLHSLLDSVSYSSLIATSLRSALSLLGSRNFQLEQDAAVLPVRDQYSLSTTVPAEGLKIWGGQVVMWWSYSAKIRGGGAKMPSCSPRPLFHRPCTI